MQTSSIVKVCKHHGPLTIEKLYKRKTTLNKNKNGYRYECHQCRIISAQKQNLSKDAKRHYKKRSVDLLLDYYVKDRLVQDGFNRGEISDELVDAKRAMIMLVRKIRERKNNVKKTQINASK